MTSVTDPEGSEVRAGRVGSAPAAGTAVAPSGAAGAGAVQGADVGRYHLARPFVEQRTDQLDIRRQLHVIRRHFLVVLTMSVLTAVVAGGVGLSGTSVWRARVRLTVNREAFVRISPELQVRLTEDRLDSELKKALAVDEGERLKADAREPRLLPRVSVSVRSESLSSVLVSVESEECEAATTVAGRAEDAFCDTFRREIRSEMGRLAEDEGKRESKLVEISEELTGMQSVRRRLERLEADLDDQEMALSSLRAREQALAPPVPGARGAAEEAANAKRRRLVQQIVDLEMLQADMKVRYTEQHPEYRSVTTKLNRLREELDSLAPHGAIGQVDRGALRASIAEAEARKRELASRIAEEKVEIEKHKASAVQLQLRSTLLQQEVMSLGDRASRLALVETVRPVESKGGVETVPPPSTGHRLARSVPFGLILGLVMGVILALAVEHLRDTCSTPGEVFQDLNMPTLAVLPRVMGGRTQISSADPHTELAEMFSILRNNLRYSAPGAPHKLVLVTSPTAGDGKSFVAANLAISYSFEGLSVLLVDADMRRSKGFNGLADGRGPGLVGWLEGRVGSPGDVVVPGREAGLSLLPAGGKAANATKLVSSPRMEELLRWAEANYDVVVVDTPAVLPVADTTIFANLARSVIVVIDSSRTRSGAAQATVSRLTHVQGNVVGAVLNRADQRAMGYMSYYGAKYGYGYGYTSYR